MEAAALDATAPTASVLYGLAKGIQSNCGTLSRDFMRCKKADLDPKACLEKGAELTKCVMEQCVARRAARRAPPARTQRARAVCRAGDRGRRLVGRSASSGHARELEGGARS